MGAAFHTAPEALDAARVALADDAAFDAAWQEGRAMPLDEAVALAQGSCAEGV